MLFRSDELSDLLSGHRSESLSATALPDTLISDHRLPGINGVQLVDAVQTQLQEHGLPLRCLLISGDTAPAEIAQLSASGHDVLAKPFRSERLLEHLLRDRPEQRDQTTRAA